MWSSSSPCWSKKGAWDHSKVNVAKLQCKTVGHGLCLFWWGEGGVGNHSHFWPKTVCSAQTTFIMLITGPLSYWIGNKFLTVSSSTWKGMIPNAISEVLECISLFVL